MHPAISTHICGGSIAAVKMSFSGEHATCGMPDAANIPGEDVLNPFCCHNEMAVYSTDKDYTPATFHFNLSPELTTVFLNVPAGILISEVNESSSYYYTGSPPGDLEAGAVSLSGLCTFRI